MQHANDQFLLDLKKIGLDFTQIQKGLLDPDRGLLTQIQSLQALSDFDDIDNFVLTFDHVSQSLSNLKSRVGLNDQKLRVLQENHGESVRYLREYRENFRRIAGEYSQQLTSQGMSQGITTINNEISGDQLSVN